MAETNQYSPVRRLTREHKSPHVITPIRLKDGSQLQNITPFNIAQRQIEDKPALIMYYLDANQKVGQVNVSTINGLDVVSEGDDLFILFTYFNPKTSQPEPKQRKVKFKEMEYGLHPNHKAFGESDDFYMAVDDMQYQEGQRDRNFPLWRMGIYGDPATLKSHFINSSS